MGDKIQAQTRSEFLSGLFKECGLLEEDSYVLSFQGTKQRLISRSGIEKIQRHHGITVKYEVISCEKDFAAVKGLASWKNKETGVPCSVESFGSAYFAPSDPKSSTSKSPHVLAMSEKRALSRCILKATGSYEMGIFGSDELERSDSDQQAEGA